MIYSDRKFNIHTKHFRATRLRENELIIYASCINAFINVKGVQNSDHTYFYIADLIIDYYIKKTKQKN